MLEYRNSRVSRSRTRATARLRWWLARQLLTIDCAEVGGFSPETAIPLVAGADQPERYELMLRYARCCFGRGWRLDRLDREQRGARCLECLVVATSDGRERRLWFDVTPSAS